MPKIPKTKEGQKAVKLLNVWSLARGDEPYCSENRGEISEGGLRNQQHQGGGSGHKVNH